MAGYWDGDEMAGYWDELPSDDDKITITRKQFNQAYEYAKNQTYGIDAVVNKFYPDEVFWRKLKEIVKNEPPAEVEK